MLLISLIDIYFNIMNIKSSKELVDEANKSIKVLSPEQVKKAYEKDEITLIDVRDIRELWRGNYQEFNSYTKRNVRILA